MNKALLMLSLIAGSTLLCAPAEAASGSGLRPSEVAERYSFSASLDPVKEDMLGYGKEPIRYTWFHAVPRRVRLFSSYLGMGPRLEMRPQSLLCLRPTVGFSWRTWARPVELFAEAGPALSFAAEEGVNVDAGLGIRIAFGSR
ncbi:MAG: hypothetical protein HY924_09665 [Elusimicrobia bacterium]|nr:hypothetical protein [Elusimicrobiota bacterium]